MHEILRDITVNCGGETFSLGDRVKVVRKALDGEVGGMGHLGNWDNSWAGPDYPGDDQSMDEYIGETGVLINYSPGNVGVEIAFDCEGGTEKYCIGEGYAFPLSSLQKL